MADEPPKYIHIEDVWNCENAFQNACPKKWESLEPTENDGLRYCDVCDQKVHLCETPEQFVQLGNAGHCVAVPNANHPIHLNLMALGRPSPESIRKLEQKKEKAEQWWSAAIAHNPTFQDDAFAIIEGSIEAYREEKARVPREPSKEDLERFARVRKAMEEGPEAFYLIMRCSKEGKPVSRKTAHFFVQRTFGMSFEKFNEMADRLDAEHPLEND